MTARSTLEKLARWRARTEEAEARVLELEQRVADLERALEATDG